MTFCAHDVQRVLTDDKAPMMPLGCHHEQEMFVFGIETHTIVYVSIFCLVQSLAHIFDLPNTLTKCSLI